MSIPIIIGVTGHRQLRTQDLDALRASVRQELEALQTQCPHSRLLMLTSLAEGADQLCAEVAHSLGIGYIAALPMEKEEFLRDFEGEAKEKFLTLCDGAESVLVTPPTEAEPELPSRDFLYRQAGIYIVEHCHVMLALWDGGAGTNAACGTAEAVDFVRSGSYDPVLGLSLRSPGNELVIHIFTPRRDRVSAPAGEVAYLGDRDALEKLLKETDDFNRLAEDAPAPSYSLLPAHDADAALDTTEALYHKADGLSLRFAARYRRVLSWLAVVSTAITAAFLLYDEMELYFMLFVCGAALLAAAFCMHYASASDCHRRYIEFRELAEALRVQTMLRYAGSNLEVKDLLSWSQQDGTPWVFNAMCAVSIDPPCTLRRDILDCWVNDQRDYHRRAKTKAVRADKRSETVVRIALTASIVVYIATLIFELSFGAFGSGAPQSALIRTVVKVVLGSLSAATLFISNYYGKLSLSRKCDDHAKMARFYEKMSVQLARRGQSDALLAVLAREELIENSNWCSYQKDNTPSFDL